MVTSSSLGALLTELGNEVDEERLAEITPADHGLHEVAREVLRLERDMTVPGRTSPDSVRIDRLMRFLEDREF